METKNPPAYSIHFILWCLRGTYTTKEKTKYTHIYIYIYIYIYWIEQELFVCVCHQWVIKQTCKSLFRHVFCSFLGGFNSAAVEGISLKVKLRHWESFRLFRDVSGFHSPNLDGNWSQKNMFKERKNIVPGFVRTSSHNSMELENGWSVGSPPRWAPLSIGKGFAEAKHSQLCCGKWTGESLCVAWPFFMT